MEKPLPGTEFDVPDEEPADFDSVDLSGNYPDPLVDRVGLSYLDNSGEEVDVDAFFARDALSTGEKRLAFAVVEEAINEFKRCAVSPSDADKRRFHKSTLSWIMSEDVSWPYSFVPLCHVLGVDENNLRDILEKWRRKNAPESYAPPPPQRRRRKVV